MKIVSRGHFCIGTRTCSCFKAGIRACSCFYVGITGYSYFMLGLEVSRVFIVRSQKNGAVSKVNKKFISHFTRAQRTPSAAATVQVSRALPAVGFSCLLRGRGASSQDGVQQEKAFCVLRFEVSRSVITVQRESFII
jgi:hypothetical protein